MKASAMALGIFLFFSAIAQGICSRDKDSLTLYRCERAAADDLQKLLNEPGPLGKKFRAFNQKPNVNDDGEALSLFLKTLTPKEMSLSPALRYAAAYPKALVLEGWSEGVGYLITVEESYAKLQGNPDLEARKIVFERELAGIPTLCTPNYSARWQNWTTEQCEDYLNSKAAFYERFQEPYFRKRIAEDARETLKEIQRIQASSKFAKAKASTVAKARKLR